MFYSFSSIFSDILETSLDQVLSVPEIIWPDNVYLLDAENYKFLLKSTSKIA